MSARRIIGIVLIAVGLIGVLAGGISWTREKTVVDIGPIQAKTQHRELVPIPPALGAAALVAGVLLLVIPARRRV